MARKAGMAFRAPAMVALEIVGHIPPEKNLLFIRKVASYQKTESPLNFGSEAIQMTFVRFCPFSIE
jgi:hypothetical protein